MPLRWTRELLKLLDECDVTPYRSSGPGGQKKNKTESSVRVRHRPSGITRIATESRSQSANKLRALDRVRQALEERNRRRKPRIPTKPSAESKKKRLVEKRHRSDTKRTRSPVRSDD